MLVRNFMSRDVFTVSPDATCAVAYSELTRRRVRRAPVVADDRLVGIVSMTDLLRKLVFTPALLECAAAENLAHTPVKLAMTPKVQTVAPADHVADAAERMRTHRIGAVVVVERGQIAGILTESDVFRALWDMWSWPKSRRIAFELTAEVAATEPDFAAIARVRKCGLRALLQAPRADGGRLVDLLLEGGNVEGVVADLWKLPATVLSTGLPAPAAAR